MPPHKPPAPNPQSPPLILASRSPRRRQLLADAGYAFDVMPPDEEVECGVCSESGPAGLVAELAYRKAAAIVRQLEQASEHSPAQPNPPPAPIVLAADTVAELDGFVLGKPRDESDARAMLSQLRGREHRVLTGVCLWPLPLPLRSKKRQNIQTGFKTDRGLSPFAESAERKGTVPLSESGFETASCESQDFRDSQDVSESKASSLPLPPNEGRGAGVLDPLHHQTRDDHPSSKPPSPLIRVAVTRLRMDSLSDEQLDEYLHSGAWEGKAGAFGYQDRLGWVHVIEGSESNVVGLPLELLAEMLVELNARSKERGAS